MGKLLIVTSLLALGSCSALSLFGDSLPRRAAFDLSCPEAEIELVEIDAVTAGAKGCGRRASYVYDDKSSIWIGGVSSPR